MAYPSDLKFSPTDERLVGYYLRNRVDTGKDGFITDIKLYEDEPWLLPHVNNDQFKEKNWFYFVVRTRRSGNTPKRTVPGRGGSNGGTWTTSGVNLKILDHKKVVIGHKTELAYHKKVKGKPKGDTTGWCMTEYWLASENDDKFQEVVLCFLRDKNKTVNNTVVDQLPESNDRDNNIIVEQPQQKNRDDNNNMVSNVLVSGVEGAELDSEFGLQNNDMFDIDDLLDFTHQQQPPIPPPQDMISPLQGEGEGLGLQDMKRYADELEIILEEDDDKVTHQQQQQQHPQISLPPQRQDSGSINNPLVVMEDECVNQDEIFNLVDQQAGITQPQQQQQEREMSPWNNMMTTNPCGLVYNSHGYEMQDPPVTNGANQDSYY